MFEHCLYITVHAPWLSVNSSISLVSFNTMAAVSSTLTPLESFGNTTSSSAPDVADIGDSVKEVAAAGSKTIDFMSLIDKLTLEEKVSLLAGRDFASTTGVERLNIPSLKVVYTSQVLLSQC